MSEISVLADVAGVTSRTLRRWVETGVVRATRVSPRRIELSAGEWRFLQRNVGLLAALRRALRTERAIRTAVLFGSVARAESTADSDVDVLVSAAGRETPYALELQERLARAVGRDVRVTLLRDVRETPSFLAEVVRDGRVLVDRASEWRELAETRDEIDAHAREADRELNRRAWQAADLVAEISRR